MYIIAEGDLPICLCAHMDTVFSKPPTTFYYDQKETVLWSPEGLGADDRAGNYVIIELLERGYRPSIILTDLEERGGVGADTLVKKYPDCPFEDCRALIQLDRQGSKDAVYYECDNKDFEKKITSYGFETEIGTFTDISIFGPQWGIAAVNLSVGYYDEHNYIETLNMTELHQTIDKVDNMLKDCKDWQFYTYIPYKYSADFIIPSGWIQENCVCCGKTLKVNEGHLCGAMSKVEEDFLVCDDCYSQFFLNLPFDSTESESPKED